MRQSISSGPSRRRAGSLHNVLGSSRGLSCNSAVLPLWPNSHPILPPPRPSARRRTQVMQSFMNFQGQVLRLAQGDACPLNCVGNSSACIAVGPGHGAACLDPLRGRNCHPGLTPAPPQSCKRGHSSLKAVRYSIKSLTLHRFGAFKVLHP